MEYYEWKNNASKKSIETLFGKPAEEIQKIDEYSTAVNNLMNEGNISSCYSIIMIDWLILIFIFIVGESEYTVSKYGEAVRNILGLPAFPQSWRNLFLSNK